MSEIAYLKIACERCSGHIEYPSEMAGQSIQCPHCQHVITLSSPPPPIPSQRTPGPPPVPNFAPPSPSRQISTHPLKTVGCVGSIGSIVAIGIVASVIWFAYNSSKPKLFAKVEVTSKAVRITNGNDTAWDSPTVILNDGFAGHILVIAGTWAPHETRELSLDDFQGRFNHQPFKPGYEEVRQVTIQARGFQLGLYETR
jgi:hypothetical protein